MWKTNEMGRRNLNISVQQMSVMRDWFLTVPMQKIQQKDTSQISG